MKDQQNEDKKIKSVGIGRTAFSQSVGVLIGYADAPTELHAHHAIQICISLSHGLMNVNSPGRTLITTKCLIIPSGIVHSFEAKDVLVALIYVEPASCVGIFLSNYFNDSITEIEDELLDCFQSSLSEIFYNGCNLEILRLAEDFINYLAFSKYSHDLVVDPRVLKAQSLVIENINKPLTLSEVAKYVNLSPERFRHLFVQETGIRFRQYIVWTRIWFALLYYSSGETITQSALLSGFADSSHFTRNFRKMFGFSPNQIQFKFPNTNRHY